jgi:hypothetical protein
VAPESEEDRGDEQESGPQSARKLAHHGARPTFARRSLAPLVPNSVSSSGGRIAVKNARHSTVAHARGARASPAIGSRATCRTRPRLRDEPLHPRAAGSARGRHEIGGALGREEPHPHPRPLELGARQLELTEIGRGVRPSLEPLLGADREARAEQARGLGREQALVEASARVRREERVRRLVRQRSHRVDRPAARVEPHLDRRDHRDLCRAPALRAPAHPAHPSPRQTRGGAARAGCSARVGSGPIEGTRRCSTRSRPSPRVASASTSSGAASRGEPLLALHYGAEPRGSLARTTVVLSGVHPMEVDRGRVAPEAAPAPRGQRARRALGRGDPGREPGRRAPRRGAAARAAPFSGESQLRPTQRARRGPEPQLRRALGAGSAWCSGCSVALRPRQRRRERARGRRARAPPRRVPSRSRDLAPLVRRRRAVPVGVEHEARARRGRAPRVGPAARSRDRSPAPLRRRGRARGGRRASWPAGSSSTGFTSATARCRCSWSAPGAVAVSPPRASCRLSRGSTLPTSIARPRRSRRRSRLSSGETPRSCGGG